jgi:hypothetical protein
MRFPLSFAAAILTIAVSFFTASADARADSYKVFDLGDTNGRNIYGIDTSGTVVVSNLLCPGNISVCYQTYFDGNLTSGFLPAPPSLMYDNGSPCTPSLPAGDTVFHGECNNGREVFGALFSSPLLEGVFTGPNPVADFFYSGSADKIALNAAGDFAWTDGVAEELFQAVDLTTESTVPEPDSILLLGSGVLAAAGVLRRGFAMPR